jgi:hypothetical protein
LLLDLNSFLQKASSLGVTGASRIPTSISDTTRQRIANEVKNPGFDVWTGTSDKTIRKLAISLTVPVHGQLSTLLGGLSSAQIGLTMQYADLNQRQTITPPTSVRPYKEFAAKLRTFFQALQGTVGGALSGGSSAAGAGSAGAGSAGAGSAGAGSAGAGSAGAGSVGTTPSASPSSGAGSAANLQSYSQCLQAAGSDVAKMQRCAPLLNKKK